MPHARRRRAAVLAVVALAIAPGAALAQEPGAGDDQYQDPFSGQAQTTTTESQPPAQPEPAPEAPAGGQRATTPAAGAQPASPGGSATSAAELPRTGFDVLPAALVGLALVLAGLALRRRGGHDGA